ncbi:MAG: hypothetical protein LC804_27725 [Acidobacteria bacterium]|nr:hypothetical protein [Acidobacteriota bacterium]
MAPSEIQRDLQVLAAELKRLEAEYNMFFAGRLPRPPWETRGRVDALLKRWDRGLIETSAERFRFQTLQARYAAFADLWDRGQRAREEGRPGPFARKPAESRPAKDKPDARIVHVTAFTDPMKEIDKLHALYDSLMDARREVGEDVVPFHKFAGLVKEQVKKIRETGSPEVAFRVATKDGKVNFTVKGMKGGK